MHNFFKMCWAKRFSLKFVSRFPDFYDYDPILKKYKVCDKEQKEKKQMHDFAHKDILPYLLSGLGARDIAMGRNGKTIRSMGLHSKRPRWYL